MGDNLIFTENRFIDGKGDIWKSSIIMDSMKFEASITPKLKFIKPKKKSKSWNAYRRWFNNSIHWEIWMTVEDCSFPFARV